MPDDSSADRRSQQRRIAALEAENELLRARLGRAGIPALEGAPSPLASRAFESLLDHASDLIWTLDLDLRPLYLSPAFERLRGFTVEEGLAQTPEEYLTPDSLRRARELLERVVRGDADAISAPIELELIRADGTTVWTETVVTLMRDAGQRPAGLIGITRDISERRRFLEELASRNELLESIFSNLRQIFFALNVPAQRVEHISPACETIYGLPAARFYEDPMTFLTPALPEDRPRLQSELEALFEGRREETVVEYRIQHPDGSVPWLRARIHLHRDDAGQVAVLHGFVSDISNRKRLEEQLLQSQKMEAVGTLAGGVAHDMNNVLGVVMGLASVLEAGLAADHPLRRHVDGILNAARRGRDLTRNLLGFAHKGRFHRERINLNDVVEECLDIVQRTVSKAIVVRTHLSGVLDRVEGDPSQLNHVLMNLCLNAADAMEEAGGTLNITTKNVRLPQQGRTRFPELSAGRYVQVQVTDSGQGIPPELLARAFEPFFTSKPRGRGTGLGLAMVYGTVSNHGGAVELESAVGQGTTATVLLPAADQRPATSSATRPPSSSDELEAAASAVTVLLVDDERQFRDTGALMLSQLGHHVETAADGAAALEQVRQLGDELGLVVLDLQMPVMDGEETFHRLRSLAPHLPVLLCSGYAREEKAERLLAAGARGYLHKPFELGQLRKAVHRALGAG